MFESKNTTLEPGKAIHYRLLNSGREMKFQEVLDAWANDVEFQAFFSRVLAEAPIAAYRWETPGISAQCLSREFEFVLLAAPSFVSRKTDFGTYASYFQHASSDSVVAFQNLSGDATLVVPVPSDNVEDAAATYGHLAAFVRGADAAQKASLWAKVSEAVQEKLGQLPQGGKLWLSTAGGGVAWLHVRLDRVPKYYGHVPFRT